MHKSNQVQYQSRLKQALETAQLAFLTELRASHSPFISGLIKELENSPTAEWVEIVSDKVNPALFENFNDLLRLEAALCQIDIGQYGFCCDCEKPIEADRLERDPSSQRCKSCEPDQ